jgi:hypothetical protein
MALADEPTTLELVRAALRAARSEMAEAELDAERFPSRERFAEVAVFSRRLDLYEGFAMELELATRGINALRT